MSEGVSSSRTLYEAVWSCLKLSEAMLNYIKLPEVIWSCLKLFESVWICLKLPPVSGSSRGWSGGPCVHPPLPQEEGPLLPPLQGSISPPLLPWTENLWDQLCLSLLSLSSILFRELLREWDRRHSEGGSVLVLGTGSPHAARWSHHSTLVITDLMVQTVLINLMMMHVYMGEHL